MTSEPELICPRCGCGMDSGVPYPSCADYPDDPNAHARYCTRSAPDVCEVCDGELRAALDGD